MVILQQFLNVKWYLIINLFGLRSWDLMVIVQTIIRIIFFGYLKLQELGYELPARATMVNYDETYEVFDFDTRIVLVEKAPFLVKNKLVMHNLTGEYEYCMIRKINKFEWENILSLHLNSEILTNKNKLYVVTDYGVKNCPTNSKSSIGVLICEGWFELINPKSFTQLIIKV